MAAFSTRGLKVYLEKVPSLAVADNIISVSNAAPAVITPTTPASFPDGTLVKVAGTGMKSLDGRWFKIKSAAAGVGAAVTTVVAGTATASATITVGGGPAGSSGTVTLTADAGVAIAGLTTPVSVVAGETAAQVATKIAAMLNGKTDTGATVTLVAVAVGAVVTVTEAGGANIATLTAVVAGTTPAAAGALTLACSDASGEAAPATKGTVTPYNLSTDFVPFCINSLSREVPAGEVISVATFCDPEAQVSGAPAGAGTLTWGGPINFSDAGFCEMQKAIADGKERAVVVEFPNGIGHMAIPAEINSYSESMELNAAATWTGGAIVKSKPSYLISETGSCTC